MAFDGIMTRALTNELSDRLTEGRFSKIAQPEPDELLIQVKTKSGAYRLLLSANASVPLVYLTEDTKQSPMTAPSFCMLLRKHLSGCRILSVTQPGLERIVDFHLEHLDELGDLREKHLIVELMGKHSNIIFTDEENRILDAIKRVPPTVSSVRTVLPGQTWFITDTQGKKEALLTTREDFLSGLDPKDRLSDVFTKHYTGFSYQTVSEFLYAAGFDADTCLESLTDSDREKLADLFIQVTEQIRNGDFHLEIAYRGRTPEAFSAFPLSGYHNNPEFEIVTFDSPSALLRTYYKERNTVSSMRQRTQDMRKTLQTHLERAVKKMDLQKKQLSDTDRRELYRLYGELLNAYSYQLPSGEKSVTVLNYYDNEELTIPVDPDLTISENAKRYFDRYGKLKRTYQALSELLPETEAEFSHLRSILSMLELAEDPNTLTEIRMEMAESGYIRKSALMKNGKRERVNSKPYHYVSSDGFDIYVGKNNFQNDELTFRFASGNDIFMHAKKAPGSHVIIRTEGREVPDRTYEEAGALAAYYSSLRSQSKAEIDYIEKKHVKKPAGGKPGFVVYYTNYSLMAEPDIRGIRQL